MSMTIAEIRASLAIISANLDEMTAAKVTPAKAFAPVAKTAKVEKVAKARKVAKPAKSATVEGKRCLTRKNRAQFVAEHSWAKGLGTAAIATAILDGSQVVTGVWTVGPRRAEQITAKTAPVVETVEAKPAKARKAKASKPKARTAAQIAASEAPRRADGKATPKREWAMREELAYTAKYDRYEIDAQIELAYRDGSLKKS